MSDALEKLKIQLSEARNEIDRLQRENSRLRSILSSFSLKPASKIISEPKPATSASLSKKTSPASPKFGSETATLDRIRLFRSLFRGRDDVYAVRWESKQGKSGYSPACAHEWAPSICKKPAGKCTRCEYLSLTDETIYAHLAGSKTIGIYPLLGDDTCWFLAADFDKKEWQTDAQFYLQACADMGVPAYLERSRSGTGGHVWIFFENAVSAAAARNLGSALLTAAMDGRHGIGMDSYDRLFPSQDTLPKGGFGNLIVLPLQRSPRKAGNSEFVDSEMNPFPNQWEFLRQVRRVPVDQVEDIVQKAERQGQVVGVRATIMDPSLDQAPWTLPPSRKRAEPPLRGPQPTRLIIVQSNLLYVAKSELSPSLTNRIVRLAAFQNPDFYAAQAMRLSTFGKPRVIGCAEEFPNHIALPRGCLADLVAFLEANGIEVEFRDERFSGNKADFTFTGTLTDDQKRAGQELLKYDDGVLVAPPGFGKTVLATWIIAQRKVNALILVHRKTLLEHWREQLKVFLGISKKSVGVIGAGRKSVNGMVDIAMLQSLQRKGNVADLVAEYAFVIVDECHHIPAFTFERILKEVKARYVLGLTATPNRKDGHHPIIFMQCGAVRHRIPKASRQFQHLLVPRKTAFAMPDSGASIHEIYAALIRDSRRNEQIVTDVLASLSHGATPLVLTERLEHLETLETMLQEQGVRTTTLKGGMSRRELASALESLSCEPGELKRAVIATGRFAGEGFDYSGLDTLFLTMPIAWRGTLEQYVGRLHRKHKGKSEVRVYDYVDAHVPLLSHMYAKRLRGYRAMGYEPCDPPGQLSFS